MYYKTTTNQQRGIRHEDTILQIQQNLRDRCNTGFLISNYQTEIPEYFIPGEDIVLYDSPESLMQLVDYYLQHDSERREIAHNAFMKTMENHTYVKRIELMLESL